MAGCSPAFFWPGGGVRPFCVALIAMQKGVMATLTHHWGGIRVRDLPGCSAKLVSGQPPGT